jgi:rhodanese-related sulfurtransferase
MKDRKLFYLLYLFITASIMFVNVGCSKDEETVTPPVTVNESEELVKYLEANGDFINTSAPAMITATDVNALLNDPTVAILDIRSATDYATGHIQGAVNVTIADILNYYRTNNLAAKSKVVVTCYTGQSAGFAVSLLRLAGYSNVYDLKWGMCSWNDTVSGQRWHNAMINGQTNPITKQTTANAKNIAGNLPTLSTGKTTGAEILENRLAALSTEGYSPASITRDVLYQNLSNYYIVNYWSEADYNSGHIEGAIQYTPKADLKLATFLKTLPTNKTIVVYCYTGQTSSHVAVFLRALGYDAKTLSYGANNLFYDTMPGTKWVDTECKNFPVVQ